MRSSQRSWAVPEVLTLLVALLLTHCSSGNSRVTAGARLWFEGPVHWLMLPAEAREFRGVRTNRQALDYIEEFWRRRDPTPEDPENPFRERFFRRVEAADRLYAERGRRGSLTDRGRVLILFGPPPILRYRQKAVPALEPDPQHARSEVRTRWMTQEVWVYPRHELEPPQQRLLEEEGGAAEIAFVFVVEPRRTYLEEGEGHLALAVHAAVRSP